MAASIITLDANEHPIKSVSIFKSNKAEVVRTFSVSLEGGQTKIRIRHLPDSIDTESARVTGLGDAQLFDVVCSVGSCIEEVDVASTAEAVRKLNARKDVLVKDLDILRLDILQLDIPELDHILELGNIPELDHILELDHIPELDHILELDHIPELDHILELDHIPELDIPTDIQLKLTYLVRSAIWSAAYELHATTEAGTPAPSVFLHYRARITQSTGEDWTDIQPPPIQLEVQCYQGPTPSGSISSEYGRVPAPLVVPVDEWQDIEEVDVNTIGEPTSVVHESPLALAYHVEGAPGVPSDGVPHQVTIAVLPFEAKIQYVTVRKVRPVAYLQATVKNTSDYRLLPGTVHALVDDSFVSKTGIVGDVAPGDVFNCMLGADPATRIQYARTFKHADGSERSAFSEQWAATMYCSRTTVTNRHPFALRELVVRDGVPVCEDEKREGGREGDGDGEGEGEGKKKQRVRWCTLQHSLSGWLRLERVTAGEELTIETEWDVKAPVSLNWIEST
ncbi:protein of unknown function (DUF4139) domain containing protein [Russula decolorans]